jgi:hypothetical protein
MSGKRLIPSIGDISPLKQKINKKINQSKTPDKEKFNSIDEETEK